MKAGTIGGAVILLLCAGGAPVEAQGVASSFDQLAVLVKPGDEISVIDVTGRKADRRIGTLSRDALTLVTEGVPRRLGEGDIAQIRQRRNDSLKNGPGIGAVAGAAYFVTAAALLGDSDGGDVILGTAIAGACCSRGWAQQREWGSMP